MDYIPVKQLPNIAQVNKAIETKYLAQGHKQRGSNSGSSDPQG